ncbi:MAG: DUF11 domain-containing protein, partial [Actinobacteria bacterium]|nr:DUF11 domain-containing protein [Actinomycetota bacterium]
PDTRGVALDPGGKLYVAGYTSNTVSRFTNAGTADGTYGSGYSAHPGSIAFDSGGNGYVGLSKGQREVVKLSPAGDTVRSYDVATEGSGGAGHLDLAAGGCTLVYTSGGDAVKRFDACSGTQLADLATMVPGTAAAGVRALPDGGALVAGTQSIVRLAASGAVVGTFDKLGHDCWVDVAPSAVGGQFWAADACLSQVVRFDLASGSVLGSFATGTAPGSVGGLAVVGGTWTPPAPGPQADLSVAQSDTPAPASSDNDLLYRVTVSNAGPDTAAGVTLQDVVSGGQIRSIRGAGWTCSSAGAEGACSLDSNLAAGASAPAIDVVVRTPESAGSYTLENTATVDSAASDPVPANDESTKSTTVAPAGDGTATAYIPPEGGQVTTQTGPCADAVDTTCGTAIFPAGPGGIASLVEYPAGITVCVVLDAVCVGDAVDVIVPDGYMDPANPIVFRLIVDESLTPVDQAPALIEKIVNGVPVTFAGLPCPPGGPTGAAPCLFSTSRDGNNDLVWEFHFLSGDPKFQAIFPE